MNQHHIAGRIGKNYGIRQFADGNSVLTFSVATKETWKDKQTNEKKEVTDWHNCVLRGRRAEALDKHLVKGLNVSICGRSVTRDYETRDGEKRRTTEIQVRELTIHWPPKDGGYQQQAAPPMNPPGQDGSFAPPPDDFGLGTDEPPF